MGRFDDQTWVSDSFGDRREAGDDDAWRQRAEVDIRPVGRPFAVARDERRAEHDPARSPGELLELVGGGLAIGARRVSRGGGEDRLVDRSAATSARTSATSRWSPRTVVWAWSAGAGDG